MQGAGTDGRGEMMIGTGVMVGIGGTMGMAEGDMVEVEIVGTMTDGEMAMDDAMETASVSAAPANTEIEGIAIPTGDHARTSPPRRRNPPPQP
jgi:hypothetical protein